MGAKINATENFESVLTTIFGPPGKSPKTQTRKMCRAKKEYSVHIFKDVLKAQH